MSRRLLDTNIWIAAGKLDKTVLRRIGELRQADIVSCSVVRAKLIYGARKSAKVAENLARYEQALAPFVCLPFDDAAADHYGFLRAQLESAGTPIGGNDLQIAAIALAERCVLVTRNRREFERIPGLAVEEW